MQKNNAMEKLSSSRKKRYWIWLAVPALLLLIVPEVFADNWNQWRGPNLNGSSQAQGLPEEWSRDSGIKWSVPLPGEGGSTPVCWDNRIFLTCSNRDDDSLHAICIDGDEGILLWDKKLDIETRRVPYNTDAAPSAVTDGTNVYFMFGGGQFFALDFDGNEVWWRDLHDEIGDLSQVFLYGASPLLYRDRLYLSMIRSEDLKHSSFSEDRKREVDFLESYIFCIDPITGKDLWVADRPTEASGVECRDSYTTPMPFEHDGEAEIVTVGGYYMTGHDWKTGHETWRLRYEDRAIYRQRVVPSPVMVEDFIVGTKPRYGDMFAFRPKPGKHLHRYNEILWEFDGKTPDVPTPAYYNDRLYVLNDKKTLTCLNPKSGEPIWEADLGGTMIYHASPTAADGKIYCMNLAGQVKIVGATDEFKLLGSVDMGGKPSMSTIAVFKDSLLVRTEEALYCVD